LERFLHMNNKLLMGLLALGVTMLVVGLVILFVGLPELNHPCNLLVVRFFAVPGERRRVTTDKHRNVCTPKDMC
jgi:hypothetical protein